MLGCVAWGVRSCWGILALGLVVVGCDDRPAKPKAATTATASVRAPSSAAPTASANEGALSALHPQVVSGARLLLDKADKQEDPRVRLRMSAGILEELEERRLPVRIVGALAAASERRVVPAQRAKTVWEAISLTPSMLEAWNEACRPGPLHDGGRTVVLLFGRTKDARERAETLFAHCGWGRGGLVTLQTLTLDYDLVMLAHTLRAFLKKHGGVAPVEERALSLMARGAVAPKRPFDEDELPALEEIPRLRPSEEQILQKQVAAAHGLLAAGSVRRFFEEVVHPSEIAGIKIEEAVRVFSREGKIKQLREDLGVARGRAVRDDGDGEASVLLPWQPGKDARERLRFQLHEGKWRLRL